MASFFENEDEDEDEDESRILQRCVIGSEVRSGKGAVRTQSMTYRGTTLPMTLP